MPLHFPSRRISDFGSQIRERIELREARRLKKPLNHNDVLKNSKIQKLSELAFDFRNAIPSANRKNKSVTQNVTGCSRSSVLAGKQLAHEHDRSSGAQYSPTYASMMSTLSSSSSYQGTLVSSKSRSNPYQKNFPHKRCQFQADDEGDLLTRPSWDPPDVGPSTWWKHPPPGYYDAQMVEETLKTGKHSSSTSESRSSL